MVVSFEEMITNSGLFRAKVTIPAARGSALARPRLIDPLAELGGGHVAVVQGPAGYGKTTLIADAARESGCEIWWLSLDEFDRDASTFLQYLALAAGAEQPLLASTGEPARETLGRICDLARADSPVWIVLDDIHWLDGGSDVCQLIDYLTLRLPPDFRLILASRTPPDLPSISRLRVQGCVLDLGPDDLAFTEDEIVSLKSEGVTRLSPSQSKALLESTGGWPVAVSIAVANKKVPVDTLASFISSEVIKRLPTDLRDFITRSSVLEIMDAQACDYVTQRSDSNILLGQAEHENIPLVKLGPTAEYRLHAVVRKHLQDVLKLEHLDAFRALQQRAAEWTITNGRPERAIPHLTEAEDWEGVSEIIAAQAPIAYREGRWHAVTSWLRALPDEVRQQAPQLVVWDARILIRFGRADEALQAIEVCQQSSATIPPNTMAEIQALSAAAFRIKGDFDSAIVFARRALELAVKEDASLSVVAEAHKQLGMGLFGRGLFEESAREISAARDIADRRGDREESAVCNACLGSAMDSLGRFAEASVYLERACELWRQIGNVKELSWTLNNLAMTHFQAGEMGTARELFLEAVAKARDSDYRRAETYATASLADLDRFSGDIGSASREYQDALKLAADILEPSIQTHLLVGLSDIQRRQGDVSGSEASAMKALVNARTRHSGFEEGVAHLALARVRRHQGDLKGALAESDQALERLAVAGPSREQMELLLLRGDLLLQSRRHRSKLIDTLSKLAELVSQSGLGSLLAQIGNSHLPVLEYGASKKVAGKFYHELIRNMRTGATVEAGDGGAFPTVEICSLGSFSVTLDGRTIRDSEWESDKSKELLLLLLEKGSPITRDEIISALWPDAGGARANSVFHSSVYRLRQALYRSAVVQSSGAYALNPEGVFRWDVARFRQLIGTMESVEPGSNGSPVENLHAASELYSGPLAPDFDSPWIDDLRSDLDTLFIDAMSRLADQLLDRGDGNGALKVARRLLDSDPFSESACRRVMRSAVAANRNEIALRTYERFAAVLRDELDERPSEALIELARSLTANAAQISVTNP